MRRLQLEDISKQLGYSKTLISMVLNGKGSQYGISKKTQAKVLAEITKFDYVPNKFARSLRTGKSYFIGLIVSDIGNTFYSKIAKSIERVLSENGYNLLVCSTDEDSEREKLLVEMMVNQQGVDGLIISSTLDEPTFYEHSRFVDFPILFIDRTVPNLSANYVVVNNFKGSVEIVNNLIKKGAQSLACFTTPIRVSTIDERLKGFKSATAAAGIEDKNAVVREIALSSIHEDIEQHLQNFIDTKTIPDAIFTLNNTITMALLKALKKLAFSKLSKVNIGCFDSMEIFDIVEKKLVAISQPIETIGETSSKLILNIISGDTVEKSGIVLEATLIEH